MLAAIAKAGTIEFSAWILNDQRYVRALEAAADRGAQVELRIERHPFQPSERGMKRLARRNAALVRELRGHGADARLVDWSDAPLHLKSIVVDHRRAFLDDRNFAQAGADEIVRTDRPADIALLENALEGRGGKTIDFATRKDFAQQLEAEVIDSAPAGAPVRCASEFFGPGIVNDALLRRAEAGENVELVVDRRSVSNGERSGHEDVLRRLARAGAEIRVAERVGKACVAGSEAWQGSANATEGFPYTLDWGMRSADPPIVRETRREFDRAWDAGARYLIASPRTYGTAMALA